MSPPPAPLRSPDCNPFCALRRRQIFASTARRSPASHTVTAGAPPCWRTSSVHEPEPPEDPDAPLSFSMEGYPDHPPPALNPAFLGTGLEFGAGTQQVSGRGGRVAHRRGSGCASDRAAAEPEKSRTSPTYRQAFERRAGEWLVVPLHHIFGTEELSALAPAHRRTCGKALPCAQSRRCGGARPGRRR